MHNPEKCVNIVCVSRSHRQHILRDPINKTFQKNDVQINVYASRPHGRKSLKTKKCLADKFFKHTKKYVARPHGENIFKEHKNICEDIAKRLVDYGFHAPTMSFPVAGTLMVEPTESEGLAELDRFCDAMSAIRAEIDQVAQGHIAIDESPLRHSPHTAEDIVGEWEQSYSREVGVYPPGVGRQDKYWPPVSRIDQAFGDRNLVCACPPVEDFAAE